jgi:hypothetical protein
MDVNNSTYIHELEAIIACEQSDGYLKMWARERLEEIQHPVEFVLPPAKILVAA